MAQGKNIRINTLTSKLYIPAADLAELGLFGLEGATEITADSVSYTILDSGRHWCIVDGSPVNTIVDIGSITGGVPLPAPPSPFPPPVYSEGQRLNIETNMTRSFFPNRYPTDIPFELPVEGDSIGTVYDLTQDGLLLRANTQANRPTLEQFQSLNSSFYFNATADTIDYGSTSYYKFLHSPTQEWAIQLKVGLPSGTNGQSLVFLTTNDLGNSLSYGVYVWRRDTNLLAIASRSGGTGGFFFTHSSTVDESMGIANITISVNGPGTGTGSLTVNGITETFDVGAGVDQNATDILRIGGTSTASCLSHISHPRIYNRPLTSEEISEYESYNPELTSDPFTPIVLWEIDPDKENTVFSDTSGTIPAVDGDDIGRINTGNELNGLNRFLTGDTLKPKFIENQYKGHNAIEFFGGDQNLIFNEWLFTERGGRHTTFIVTLNRDVALGSHPLSGELYLALTGSDYAPSPPSPRYIFHYGDNLSPIGQPDVEGGNDVKVISLRRDGDTLDSWNTDGDKVSVSCGSHEMTYSEMGKDNFFGGDWAMDGYIYYMVSYRGVASDSQIETITATLKAKYK